MRNKAWICVRVIHVGGASRESLNFRRTANYTDLCCAPSLSLSFSPSRPSLLHSLIALTTVELLSPPPVRFGRTGSKVRATCLNNGWSEFESLVPLHKHRKTTDGVPSSVNSATCLACKAFHDGGFEPIAGRALWFCTTSCQMLPAEPDHPDLHAWSSANGSFVLSRCLFTGSRSTSPLNTTGHHVYQS